MSIKDQTKKMKVLYADDDPDNCELFNDAIVQSGLNCDLKVVYNGIQALLALPEFFPDIVFLDLNMPLLCGKKCLKEIRSNADFNSIPVIIFSTSRSVSDIDQAFADDANLYVFKPDTFTEQNKIVKKVFKLYKENGLWKRSQADFVLSLDKIKN
jgi:PleD family two-component response regulator